MTHLPTLEHMSYVDQRATGNILHMNGSSVGCLVISLFPTFSQWNALCSIIYEGVAHGLSCDMLSTSGQREHFYVEWLWKDTKFDLRHCFSMSLCLGRLWPALTARNRATPLILSSASHCQSQYLTRGRRILCLAHENDNVAIWHAKMQTEAKQALEKCQFQQRCFTGES